MRFKNYIGIVCLTVLLIAAITWAMHERNGRKTLKSSIEKVGDAKILQNPKTPLVKKFTDSLKQNHSVFNSGENRVDGKLVAVSKSVIDTIARLSGVDKTQVTNWQQIAIEANGRALKAERRNDSLQRAVYYYEDKFLKMAYNPPKPGDTTSQGTFDYKYNADLNITDYKTGGKFLGLQLFQPDYYTDVFSTDPRMTIKGYSKLTIEQKQKPFGLKVDAIGKYDLQTKDFKFGAGARFDVGRSMLTFDTYYNPNQPNKITHEAGARFSIFK